MKNKIGLLIICLFLLATQQGKAQSRAEKALAEVATRKAAREKQLVQLRSKAAEQKGQLQFEKRVERNAALPLPARNGNAINAGGHTGAADSVAVVNRAGRKS